MNKSGLWMAGWIAAACIVLPAQAAGQDVCADGACSRAGVSRNAIVDALRSLPAPAQAQVSRVPAQRPAGEQRLARDPWAEHLAGPAGQEDYSCFLSVGVGGEFARNGFFATRVLGQTLVLGGKEKEEKRP
ncbi:hypothetical protein B0920_14960 [Massilia sp. KIM]|uniref:hypothetical protein n=1 Tax=Massilia sp. KIM TaxID=1955422 RepID=UPI00098F04F5|nr:hypothetical protein [Massilia sp. KIM]OON60293.1 hypothetical protein B0920_14960 [Massilia sp. KIM]